MPSKEEKRDYPVMYHDFIITYSVILRHAVVSYKDLQYVCYNMEEDTSLSLLGLQYKQKHLGTPAVHFRREKKKIESNSSQIFELVTVLHVKTLTS